MAAAASAPLQSSLRVYCHTASSAEIKHTMDNTLSVRNNINRPRSQETSILNVRVNPTKSMFRQTEVEAVISYMEGRPTERKICKSNF